MYGSLGTCCSGGTAGGPVWGAPGLLPESLGYEGAFLCHAAQQQTWSSQVHQRACESTLARIQNQLHAAPCSLVSCWNLSGIKVKHGHIPIIWRD